MNRRLWVVTGVIVLMTIAIFLIAISIWQRQTIQPPVLRRPVVSLPVPTREAADQPAPKRTIDGNLDPEFLRMHAALLARAKSEAIDLLFLGDSIIYRWSKEGSASWEKSFGRYRVENFAVGGERTQHLLWQIENGLFDHVQPKLVVLCIGTNNTDYPTDDMIAGIKQVVSRIRSKLPASKLLLLGVLPRDWPQDAVWAKIKAVNGVLAKLDDGHSIRFVDPATAFLNAKGNISIELMPDLLHPSAMGYQALTDFISPTIDQMMK